MTSIFSRYASFLSQYSAVSFGDALFGCFVILPLAQRHDVKFRRAVWDEHIGVLRALSIPLGQVRGESACKADCLCVCLSVSLSVCLCVCLSVS